MKTAKAGGWQETTGHLAARNQVREHPHARYPALRHGCVPSHREGNPEFSFQYAVVIIHRLNGKRTHRRVKSRQPKKKCSHAKKARTSKKAGLVKSPRPSCLDRHL